RGAWDPGLLRALREPGRSTAGGDAVRLDYGLKQRRQSVNAGARSLPRGTPAPMLLPCGLQLQGFCSPRPRTIPIDRGLQWQQDQHAGIAQWKSAAATPAETGVRFSFPAPPSPAF